MTHGFEAKLVALALESPDPRVQLAAIRDLLDRAGVRAPKQLEVVITKDMVASGLVEFEEDADRLWLDQTVARLEAEMGVSARELQPRSSYLSVSTLGRLAPCAHSRL